MDNIQDHLIKLLRNLNINLTLKYSIIFLLQTYCWKYLTANSRINKRLSFHQFLKSEITWDKIKAVFSELQREYGNAFLISRNMAISDSVLTKFMVQLQNTPSITYIDILLAGLNISSLPFISHIFPQQVTSLICKLMSADKNTRIYQPLPANFGLGYQIVKMSDCHLFTEAEELSQIPYLLNILEDIDITFHQSSPLSHPSYTMPAAKHLLQKFDFSILDLLPDRKSLKTNIQDDIYNRFRSTNEKYLSDIYLIEHVISQTEKKAIVIIPNSFLFRTVSKERSLKEYLVDNRLIETVISLPLNLLQRTTASFSILVFNVEKENQEVLFINATSDRFYNSQNRKSILLEDEIFSVYQNRKEVDGVSRIIGIDKIKEKNYDLSPNQYALSKEHQELNKKLSNLKSTKLLSQIAEIIRPPILYKKDKPSSGEIQTEVKEVGSDNIPDCGFINSYREKVVIERETHPGRYHLRPYDILFSAKGVVGRVGIVPDNIERNWITCQPFIIVRIKEGINFNPLALIMFLKSNIVKLILQQANPEGVFNMVKIADLENIPVPLSKEQELVDSFYREIELYKQIRTIQADLFRLHDIL